MEYVVFAIVAVLQIYFCAVGNMKGKYIIKPFIIPSILLIYLVNASEIQYFLVAGLILGWIGDLLLISKKTVLKSFLGPLVFALGHFSYAILFLSYNGLKTMPAAGYIMLLIYVLWGIVLNIAIFPKIPKDYFKFVIGAYIYLLIIMFMSFSSYTMVWVLEGSFITFLGSWFFIVSDSMIIYRNFVRKFRGDNVFIMSTYIVAQFLIILNFI